MRVQRGVVPAAARNRAKRLLREAYRRECGRLAPGHDLFVMIVKRERYRLEDISRELRTACERLGLVVKT